MLIKLKNTYAEVHDSTIVERRWLRQHLTFRPITTAGITTGKPTTLFRETGPFPHFLAGLTQLVARDAQNPREDEDRETFPVRIVDARTAPCSPVPDADLAWLADHQREGVEAVAQHTRGVLAHATSAGKGEVAVALSRAIPCNWLFAAHRYTLVADIADRYERRTHMRAGRIGDGMWDADGSAYVCATWQSLHARLSRGDRRAVELLSQVEGVIADEVHTLPAETYSSVLEACPNAYWRVGLSGTPLDRLDQKSIYTLGHIGPVIHTVKARELVEKGFAAACRVKMIKCAQSLSLTPMTAYDSLVVHSEERNSAIVFNILREELPAIVFVKTLAHGRILKKLIERAGVLAETLFGNTPAKRRADVMRSVVREGRSVLITNKVAQEGEIDASIVEFRTVCNAAGGSSTIAVLQQLGRGMRRRDSKGREVKSEFVLIDVYDKVDGHRDHSLTEHSRMRHAAYTRAGHDVEAV